MYEEMNRLHQGNPRQILHSGKILFNTFIEVTMNAMFLLPITIVLIHEKLLHLA